MMIVLFVNRELPSLSESFGTSIDTTDERLLTGMCVLMFLQVLRKREGFLTMDTDVFLGCAMFEVVPLQRKLT